MEEKLIPDVFARGGTVNYGVIHGGTQLSTVAGECELLVDRRYTSDETYESMYKEFTDLLDELSAKDPKFKCEMEVLDVSVMKEGYVHEPAYTPLDSDIVKITKKYSVDAIGEDYDVVFIKAWTDAGLISTYQKTPVIICGPGLMECCHALHEYVPVDHLPKASLMYAMTAVEFCGIKE